MVAALASFSIPTVTASGGAPVSNTDIPPFSGVLKSSMDARTAAAESRPAEARTGEQPLKLEDRTASLIAVALGPMPLALQSLTAAGVTTGGGGAAGSATSAVNQSATAAAGPGATLAAGAAVTPATARADATQVPSARSGGASVSPAPPMPGERGQSGSVAAAAPPTMTADAFPHSPSPAGTTLPLAPADAGGTTGGIAMATPSGKEMATAPSVPASAPASAPPLMPTRLIAELGEPRLPDPPQPAPPAPSAATATTTPTAAPVAAPIDSQPSASEQTAQPTVDIATAPTTSAEGVAVVRVAASASAVPADETSDGTDADSGEAAAALAPGSSATAPDGTTAAVAATAAPSASRIDDGQTPASRAAPLPSAVATQALGGTAVIAPARSIDQVADGLTLTIREGKTEATLSLRPASLGEVKVQISGGADGLIIRIAAERDAVSELLRSRVGELRDLLGGRQIAVSEVHVLPNPPALTGGHAQDAAPQQRNAPTPREDDATDGQNHNRHNQPEPDDESQ